MTLKRLIARSSVVVGAVSIAASPSIADIQTLQCNFTSQCATASCKVEGYQVIFDFDPTPRTIDYGSKKGVGWTLYEPLSTVEIQPGTATDAGGQYPADISYLGGGYTFYFGEPEPKFVNWSPESGLALLWLNVSGFRRHDLDGSCVYRQE